MFPKNTPYDALGIDAKYKRFLNAASLFFTYFYIEMLFRRQKIKLFYI
jgi:hypothetical protein